MKKRIFRGAFWASKLNAAEVKLLPFTENVQPITCFFLLLGFGKIVIRLQKWMRSLNHFSHVNNRKAEGFEEHCLLLKRVSKKHNLSGTLRPFELPVNAWKSTTPSITISFWYYSQQAWMPLQMARWTLSVLLGNEFRRRDGCIYNWGEDFGTDLVHLFLSGIATTDLLYIM